MENKVYIVHGSAIVQKGLADILQNNFKCIIKCYYDFISLNLNEFNDTPNSILFIENEIANSEEYFEFLDEAIELKSFRIVNCGKETTLINSQFAICLHNSTDEIHEKVKHVFSQKEFVESENENLSKREIDVLKLVALGYSNKEIADKLFISTHTVMSHRKKITEKLGIKSISGLTVYAIINHIIDSTSLNVKDLI